MKLATAQQMKEIDRIAIEERGIPSLELMERAALGVVETIDFMTEEEADLLPEAMGEVSMGGFRLPFFKNGKGPRKAVVFAGPGNNGGDGVAAARLLAEQGWKVCVFLVGERAKLTRDTSAMVERLAEAGLELMDFPKDAAAYCEVQARCAESDVFVDALFGVGLCREVAGDFAAAISLMNSFQQIPTISADIASGLSADTGKVLGIAVQAAATVTFSMAKPGHFADQGSLYTGKLIVHDIGIPDDILWEQELSMETIDEDFVRDTLPKRKADGHKGDFGKNYILAGSVGYTGAPVLAAKACSRMGAGLVSVGTPASAWPVVAGKCLEEMPYPLPEEDGKLCMAAQEKILEKAEKCDAVLIGPGLGRSGESDRLIRRQVAKLSQPLVLDADGINALSGHIDCLSRRAGRTTILTPHDGEFARLGGDLKAKDRISAARDFAVEHGCVLVLKGHRTIVAAPDGRIAINTTGNSGMAKGGSGDVLSGVILALLGLGIEPFRAAAAAVYLHGMAGDLCAEELGEWGMVPGDIISKLPCAIQRIYHNGRNKLCANSGAH